MLKHNFLILIRSLKRDRASILINVIGLSTGLACVLLIYLWVSDELRTDKFHDNDKFLYQVLTTHPNEDGIDTWREGPIPLAPALLQEIPEVECAVNASPVKTDFLLSNDEQNFDVSGIYVDENFFNIFSYEFLEGNPVTVLKDKNSTVITEKIALMLFNTTDNLLGKMISWQRGDTKRDIVISGILKDIPSSSSEQFDFAISFEVFKDLAGSSATWGNHQARIYLQLKEEANISALSDKIVDFIKSKDESSNVTLFLQKYSDAYLYNHFEDGKQAGGKIEYVRLFSIIAIFILLIACINFMNISTAKSFTKIKEVGIKKAVGAKRGSLILQYLSESLLIAFLAFLFAMVIVELFLPQFNIITGKQLSLILSIRLILAGVIIVLFAGLISGVYPALYLSGFRPAVVLKGKTANSSGELIIRKGLVVFQFVLSILLIVSVLVVYRQVELIKTMNPGFDRDNIIQFNIKGKLSKNPEPFISELQEYPEIKFASTMWGSIVGKTGITQGLFDWEGKDPDADIAFSHLGVGSDMLDLLGLEMISGRTFSGNYGNENNKIIINEAGIDVMGLKDPVGKTFNLWGKNYEIIGIVKNFNFRSIHEGIKPLFFRYSPAENAEKILVKINPGSEKETIDYISKLYKSFNPGHIFNYSFLSDEYQKQYLAEQRISILSKYFAGLAILISCLGLFAMSVFTAERRTKEIGIHKVMGSSSIGIVKLLFSEFIRVVIIAIGIALPLSFLLTHSWLENFAYKTTLRWWIFVLAGAFALLITLITVCWQSWKAAGRNPVEALKYE